jgi:NAD-dependent SIR2 family protein deacetylase
MPNIDSTQFARAAQLIQEADSIIIATGAGMGVDSGLPDFRGNEGFWKAYPALARAQLDFSEVANPKIFADDIRLAWGFYGHRLRLYRNTVPHDGFAILKRWGEAKKQGYSVFTSNVDGQFQRAGFVDQSIYECHGSIHHLQCLDGCSNTVWNAENFKPDIDDNECNLTNMPPPCKECGGYARPNILMFGDWGWGWGWVNIRSKRQAARQQEWLSTVRKPVVIELGAGTHIPSVRYFSEKVVKQHNGRLIRINPRECEVANTNDIGLACGALQGLKAIDAI